MSKVLGRLSPSHPHLLDSVVIVLQKVMESCPEQAWILLEVEPTEVLMEGTEAKNVAPRLVAGAGEEVQLLSVRWGEGLGVEQV